MSENDGWTLLDQISYDLQSFGDTTVWDDGRRNLVVETLARLPEEVRDKVLDEAVFILAGEAYGTLFPVVVNYPREFCFVILNLASTRKWDDFRFMSMVAHEIAHFTLGVMGLTSDPLAERKADDLCESWGFKRSYRSYKKFERLSESAKKRRVRRE